MCASYVFANKSAKMDLLGKEKENEGRNRTAENHGKDKVKMARTIPRNLDQRVRWMKRTKLWTKRRKNGRDGPIMTFIICTYENMQDA